ncbi:MAG TPA: hypothetical protein VLT33_00005, partial [Labilithrix sp.]|nr:hypothetical protein [Labilithrix sp.]
MRNQLLTAVAFAVLSLSAVACGPAGASDGTNDIPTSEPSAADGTPGADLANAPVDHEGEATNAVGAPVGINANTGGGSSSGGSSSGGGAPADPSGGAGPRPTAACTVSKDSAGFFTRTTSKSGYVAYVPAGYDGTAPMRLIVGLHGCGDSAANFATWGVNPYATRAAQTHI